MTTLLKTTTLLNKLVTPLINKLNIIDKKPTQGEEKVEIDLTKYKGIYYNDDNKKY